ncbi:MAG TPA: glucuronate isomerase [Armatimonadota bacterium]|jgi:hypothetical protein
MNKQNPQLLTNLAALESAVVEIVSASPVVDMHTHLFPPSFGALSLWGIDELLTYHYLIAELFRSSPITPSEFQAMPKPEQADRIWLALFVENTPLSEATMGVCTVLSSLGLDPRAPDLREARAYFADQTPEGFLDLALSTAGVSSVVMTNDPLDPAEAALWEAGAPADPRFHAAMRTDAILNDWPGAAAKLSAGGYPASAAIDAASLASVRRFLEAWIDRLNPLYLAVSLPDDFAWPEHSPRARLIAEALAPVCRERGLPFAMMIGVRRAVNPALGLAGDGLGRADVSVVTRLCAAYPDVRFLVTMLSRENQHELCVAARKFANLMPFGCWWFLNNPSIIAEMTAERIELLGASFIPQHSDARVLDQLLYKWPHSRRVIADALVDAYHRLLFAGRPVARDEISRDVTRLLRGNFEGIVGRVTP